MPTTAKKVVDFSKLMARLLSLLTEKEESVISRRFSLGGGKKETLDKIGKSYSITRERVRQIEMMAIKKLARISMDPSMRFIHDLSFSILSENGSVMSEDLLVSEMLKNMSDDKIDVNAMKLAMKVSDRLAKQEKNQFHRPFWHTKDFALADIRGIIRSIQKVLQQKHEVMDVKDICEALDNKVGNVVVSSVLHVDHSFFESDSCWGLASWRHINPRSIKDKVLITLKNHGKPLHFTEIAKHVLSDFGSKKSVTPQAIHNELIRHADFVLVGRGLYGLCEWGMVAGTVCDVIKSVLLEAGEPMKRQQIIENVLKKRDIRLGTISLNLQKYPFFRRVGRAVYEYAPGLDTGKQKLGRGRAVDSNQ